MSRQVIPALMLCFCLATVTVGMNAPVGPPPTQIQPTSQQTDKERKETEKRAKEEERKRKEEEKRAKAEAERFSPIANIPEGKAVVYIYKPKNYGKEKFRIEANGEPITILTRGGFYQYVVTPGTLVFTAKTKARIGNLLAGAIPTKSALTLTVERGKIYYIKEPGGFKLTTKLNLVQVPIETAEKELQNCKLLPPYTP